MTHKNLLVPNDGYECPAVNECGCPRCSWVRIKNDPDNTMIDLEGDTVKCLNKAVQIKAVF